MRVGWLEPEAGTDATLVDGLAQLVNDVYAVAEEGLWRNGATRTTGPEMAELIAAREIAVAVEQDTIVGSIRIHDVAADTSEFGILVADPEQRSTGIGRALLDFAEDNARERGLPAMQLELLVPREWTHPHKEFLKSWYGRRGYELVRTTTMDGTYPHLAPLLATACDLEIHRRSLLDRRPRD
jgi:GNAT superfamily N-acetyltransferase